LCPVNRTSTKEHTVVIDPYRINEAPRAPERSPRSGIVRPVLWLLLVISAAGNVATSSTGMNVAVSGAFGLATLGLGIALIVQHYQKRSR
jgi:hypothetical protein